MGFVRIDVAAHILPERYHARLYIRETIADLDAAGLSADRRRLVDEGNVRRLLARRQKVRGPSHP
jgi:hypothetical protein